MHFRPRPVFGLALLLGSSIAFTQCGGGSSPTAPVTTTEPPVTVVTTPPTTVDPVEIPVTPPVIPAPGSTSTTVNVLGDTGWCGSPALAPIATLLGRFDGDIILAGDLAYPGGTADEYKNLSLIHI